MPRKNKNVRRSNDKGRRARDMMHDLIPHKMVTGRPRVKVEDLILPDGKCTFMNPRKPKARFETKEKAAAALEQAQSSRARSGTGHVEKRFYRCPDGGCGGYHLSSREAFDDGLRQRRHNMIEKKRKEAQE